MGSETTPKIPIVDFSDLLIGEATWDRARDAVLSAAEEFGCFEIVYEDISREERQEFFGRLAELFALPVATKAKNLYKKPFHGYTGQRPEIPLFESLGIDGADRIEEAKSFEDLMWPQGNPGFSKTLSTISKKLVDLERMVLRMLMEGLGVEKEFDDVSDSLTPLLRVMNYKAPAFGSQMGLAPHHDMNFLTLLIQDEINGLEVLARDGTYIPVTPSPDSLVIFVADSFMAWSNGRLHSALHRVTVAGDHERFSAGLFMIPKAGWLIRAPQELVDDDHPLLYRPFDHFEFLKHFYADPRKGARATLEQHAGLSANSG